MRNALALASVLLVAGCGDTVLKKIGETCAQSSECASTDMCKDGVCTKACASQLDCPVGFDCGLAKTGDSDPTCYAAKWDMTMMGGFGADCSVYAQDPKTGDSCGGTNPCASGFTCNSGAKCDANAYCTKGCSSDSDCPPTMFCGTPQGGTLKMMMVCLNRANCSDCAVDDQCPASYVCVADPKGEKHCQKTCASSFDCPNPQGGDYFRKCQAAPDGRQVCRNLGNAPAGVPDGLCHGPSVIQGMPDGGVCANCRPGTPSDCAMGEVCYEDQFTTERFCTQSCSVTLVPPSTIQGDTCPMGSYCYWGGSLPPDCGAMCTVQGICTADSSYNTLTCHP